MIRIGPAGWSYKDWEGTVYPQKPGKNFDPLEYLARFFNTIEINSSFYRPPRLQPPKPGLIVFRQTSSSLSRAKLHGSSPTNGAKRRKRTKRSFTTGMEPLLKAGKLGALLLQFPWSFKNTVDDRLYLAELLEKFSRYPLVLEVRHTSWNTPAMYEWLEERGVGICNIDQPVFSKSIRPAALTTSPLGYVRLHGRNYQNWFREKAPRDERYNYLYTLDELEPWLKRIKEVAKQTAKPT